MADLADTTRKELEQFTRFQEHISIKGLYFEYEGQKITPSRVWFSCDLREWRNDERCKGSLAYCHYDNALRPVYMENGKQYCYEGLRNVSADYNGSWLTHFRCN